MTKLILKNPLDMHLHLRDGDMLRCVLPFSASVFSAALIMPNLTPPITTADLAIAYKRQILNALKPHNTHFTPLMSLFFNASLDKNALQKAKNAGINILKLYPQNATTGSESGVSQILSKSILSICEIAQDLGFILAIHCESCGSCIEREYEFFPILESLAKDFPRLKIIIEHISDCRTLELLEKYPNLFGTLTLHHISQSFEDMLGGKLNVHLFCKPILKSKKDKDALLNAALHAHSKISFGSDSAPHLESAKFQGAAGIFSAPVLLPALAQLFETHNALENLQAFTSDNAFRIYDLEDFAQKDIILERKQWQVPDFIECESGRIIPFYAGEILQWRIAQ